MAKIAILYNKVKDVNKAINNDNANLCNGFYEELIKVKNILKINQSKMIKDDNNENFPTYAKATENNVEANGPDEDDTNKTNEISKSSFQISKEKQESTSKSVAQLIQKIKEDDDSHANNLKTVRKNKITNLKKELQKKFGTL